MAGIASLQTYGGSSSDSEDESTENNEDLNLHLKPLDKKVTGLQPNNQIVAAPVVAVKVKDL